MPYPPLFLDTPISQNWVGAQKFIIVWSIMYTVRIVGGYTTCVNWDTLLSPESFQGPGHHLKDVA